LYQIYIVEEKGTGPHVNLTIKQNNKIWYPGLSKETTTECSGNYNNETELPDMVHWHAKINQDCVLRPIAPVKRAQSEP
jgi:hypothetical protein